MAPACALVLWIGLVIHPHRNPLSAVVGARKEFTGL
jgi:hypothetical protein